MKLIDDSIAEGIFVSPIPYVLKSSENKAKPEDVSMMLKNPGTILVERLSGQLSEMVSRKGSKLVIQVTLHNVTLLRSGKQVPESYLHSQVRDHYVYLDLDMPLDMMFEKGSGIIMYNMIRMENGDGKTLYRTPKKADSSIVHNRSCSLWVRKNGFVVTNQDKILDMETEKSLAKLAEEESVGSFEQTKIDAWAKFDLSKLKETDSLFANETDSSYAGSFINEGDDSEEEKEKESMTEIERKEAEEAEEEEEVVDEGEGLFLKPRKEGESVSSEGEEVGLSDAESTGSLWDEFPTLIPMARDLVQKLPIQSRTQRSNDRNWDDSSSDESSESDKEGEGVERNREEGGAKEAESDSEEEEEAFVESIDLWKQVIPLTPPLEELIYISEAEPEKPPAPDSFVLPQFLNGIPSTRLPKFSKRPKKEMTESNEYSDDDEVEVIAPPSKKPKVSEVIDLSDDDDDDVPLAKRKSVDSRSAKNSRSSSSGSKQPPLALPQSKPKSKSKQEPNPTRKPEPKLISRQSPSSITTTGAYKPSASPPTHPRSLSPVRAPKFASSSTNSPKATSTRPPVTLKTLEKIFGREMLEDAIDMISFIRGKEEHNEQRVNHLHHILHHNFDVQSNRFQWTKNDRRMFDADPKLKNPHTRAMLIARYEPKVMEHRRRYLKYKQRSFQ